MKLLLVEDDTQIVDFLLSRLKEAGYIVDAARDGERGCFLAETSYHDLIILDYNLPRLNGRKIIEQLRNNGNDTPILMLTVHNGLEDKVDLLNLGVDDYITKPFAFSELLARIKTITRRPQRRQENILRFGDIVMDVERYSVTKDGEEIKLAAKEFALLEYFLRNQRRILSRQDIMEHVWDENADPFSHTIEVHIMNLRKKLGQHDQRPIVTVPNRGYKFG